jgi:hypothetical protein
METLWSKIIKPGNHPEVNRQMGAFGPGKTEAFVFGANLL